MNFYYKYIFPKYLNFVMRGKDLEKHREDVVTKSSGQVLEIGFGLYELLHKLDLLK